MMTPNSAQLDAIRYTETPLLVLAGAGSGKTQVITQKIAYLIEKKAYLAKEIVAVTFTNKSANEMQQRVQNLLDRQKLKGLIVATFHAFCIQILREHIDVLGYKKNFSIFDSSDCQKTLNEILKTTDISLIKNVGWKISHWKNNLISPPDTDPITPYCLSYQKTLKSYQALDFDDLIFLTIQLFTEYPEILYHWQTKKRYFLIDEYQDTNIAQYHLIKLLVGSSNPQFTVVGDDDQAIYGWRHANIENIHLLQKDFPDLHVIKLEQNYRSSTRILRIANQLIANNTKVFDKKLWSDLGLGDIIHVHNAENEEQEAETTIIKLLAHQFEYRTTHKDYAILYRSNHQSRLLEQQLQQNKIPYTVSGGQSFFERAEIKDIISYLRLISNEDDDIAFIRASTTPKKGIGTQTLEKLGEYSQKHQLSLFSTSFEQDFQHGIASKQLDDLMTFCKFIQKIQEKIKFTPTSEILKNILSAIEYETYLYDIFEPKQAENKWRNVTDFIDWLNRKSQDEEGETRTFSQLTQLISIINILESRQDDDGVKLSTIHAAKGLEFNHVFLVGVEEGILPHQNSIDNQTVEEERRLMYVAITRAKKSLHLSWCKKRKKGGEISDINKSRFLEEILGEDVRESGEGSTTKSVGKAHLTKIRQMLAGAIQQSPEEKV